MLVERRVTGGSGGERRLDELECRCIDAADNTTSKFLK
jgi:hypothetical protein